ncbi:hypothetical protein C8J57DRAFT_1517291 [Mycena rebaudengoi]|nr:hypothetical protein C8J57DRAFT_1517291 [Mycena rebaudengoi]
MSRASTPVDPLRDIFDAMSQCSPVAPEKRTHSQMNDNTSDNEGDGNTGDGPAISANVAANKNIAEAANRYADRKRLRADQKAEMAVMDPPSLRDAKLLANVFAIENIVKAIVAATPQYSVSEALTKNLYTYGTAVLLSSKISAYKGTTPTTLLLAILKKYRFDLPPGIEDNADDWAKVIKAAQYVLTQLRSKFKKAIETSLKVNKKEKRGQPAPGSQHQNIFQLTQAFVEGTQCTVNVTLCAHVALMRQVYHRDSSSKFWDSIDDDLEAIRNKAAGDDSKIISFLQGLSPFTGDRKEHGVDNYTLKENTDKFQQKVDDVIDADDVNAVNAATSAQPASAEPDSNVEE